MFSFVKSSLLCAKISEFYKISDKDQNISYLTYFKENGTFNEKAIVDYIWPQQKSGQIFKDLKNYSYEDYLKCYNKILPIFEYSTIVIQKLTKNNLKIKWMGKNVCTYLSMMNNYTNDKETDNFEHILLLTSLLANALTNVFLTQTKEKRAPYLLKDLINSTEIETVFGIEMVLVLKILMGSPNSINLRNIVWHGFPKPLEIPQYYVNVILVIVHTLGSIIETKEFQIKERSQITTFHDHLHVLKRHLKFSDFNFNEMQQKINELDCSYKLYWLKLLTYYETGNYIKFIKLILTQIELLLRLHYGYVNNFDISAKLEEYYITIDTIFESKVPNLFNSNDISNKLLDFNDMPLVGCFHFLYDIFISPNGCRLRDKVSHGEVDLDSLNNSELCSMLLKIFLVLLFPKYYNYFELYESKLHLNSITKANILTSVEGFYDFLPKFLDNYKAVSMKIFPLAHKNVLIFKRPKKESELMLLLNKIAININKTIKNYEEAITFRTNLLAQRELHSKRRKTLEKLQGSLPEICETLATILSAINKLYGLLQSECPVVLEDHNKCDKTLRFLKHSLTTSENFVRYSHFESNEWIKSLELCHKYKEFYEKLFVFNKLC